MMRKIRVAQLVFDGKGECPGRGLAENEKLIRVLSAKREYGPENQGRWRVDLLVVEEKE